jgi:hypothetical protein
LKRRRQRRAQRPAVRLRTIVGTNPTVFPSRLCFLDHARISSLVVSTGMVSCLAVVVAMVTVC